MLQGSVQGLSYDERKSLEKAQRTRLQIARSGRVGRHRVWTNQEDAQIRALYPDIAAMVRALPSRTDVAIRYRVSSLKLARPLRPWTGADHLRLRKLYPTATQAELLAAFPDRSAKAIAFQALSRGVHKVERPQKIIGFPLVDEIRRRAKEINMTLADLDREVQSRKYFGRMKQRTFCPAWRHIAHAVKVLGGELRIEWESLVE